MENEYTEDDLFNMLTLPDEGKAPTEEDELFKMLGSEGSTETPGISRETEDSTASRQQEIDEYAQSLSNGYETADLEAAGFTSPEIQTYETNVKIGQEESALPLIPANDEAKLISGGYPTQWSAGLSYREAMDKYHNVILTDENVRPPSLTDLRPYAIYTNPESGEENFVFAPSPTWGGKAKGGMYEVAAGGIYAGVGNALELVGAGAEMLGVANATEYMDNLVPGMDTGQSGLDALITEAVPMVVAGGGVGGAIYKGLSKIPAMIKATSALVAGEAAVAAVSGNDVGTLAIGENSFVSEWQESTFISGINLDDGEAEDVIEARMNIFLDGMLATGIVGGSIQVASQVGKLGYNIFARPVVVALSPGDAAVEEASIMAVLDKLAMVDSSALKDPDKLFAIRDAIATIIDGNSEVFLRRLANADKGYDIALDSMSALQRGLIDGDNSALIAAAQGLRTAQVTKNAPLTSTAVRKPMVALDRETAAAAAIRGGDTAGEQTDAMFASADALATMGREEVTDAAATAAVSSTNYNTAANDLISDLANDVELSDEIRRLSSAVGTEIDTSLSASRNQILAQVETAYEALSAQKNNMYASIKGGEVDVDGLLQLLDDLPDEQITQATVDTKNSNPIRGLLKVVKRQYVDELDELGNDISRLETDAERAVRVNQSFASDQIDFGFFYREIRPEISQLASDQFAANSPTSGRNLRDLVRFIDEDMVDYVAKTGDPEVAADAIAAKEFYSKTFAPLFREGRLQEFSKIYDETVGRSSNQALEEGAPRIGEPTYRTATRSLVDSSMTSGDPATLQQFKRLLQTAEGGGNSAPLADYIVADTIANAGTTLRASSGTDAQLGGFSSTLRQYSEALNTTFPERAAELNELIRKVEGAQGNREQLEAIMVEAKAQVQNTLQDVQTGELRFFFRKEFAASSDPLLKNLATTSNPQQSFRTLMQSNATDRVAAMQAIKDRIDTVADPLQKKVLTDGVETAWFRLYREIAVGRKQESGAVRAINSAGLDKASDEINSIYQIGDVVFRDTPELMDSLRVTADVASNISKSRNAVPISSMSPTEFNRTATNATNRLIYATVGPLNRMGTRIKAVMGTLLESNDSVAKAERIMDRIMAEPAYFVELSRRYNNAPTDDVVQTLLLRFMFEGVSRVSINSDTESEQPLGMGLEAGMQ